MSWIFDICLKILTPCNAGLYRRKEVHRRRIVESTMLLTIHMETEVISFEFLCQIETI